MLGLNLSLSLSSCFEMERDRRAAAHMSRDQLAERCDELIQAWHQQQHLIIELQRKAANLQVELALKGAPVFGGVSDEHRQMARKVLGTGPERREGWAGRAMRAHYQRAARLGRDELALQVLGR
jgi:hypothetical protein